jgi:hypothetical protein
MRYDARYRHSANGGYCGELKVAESHPYWAPQLPIDENIFVAEELVCISAI